MAHLLLRQGRAGWDLFIQECFPTAVMGNVSGGAEGSGFTQEALHDLASFEHDGSNRERRGNKIYELAES